VDRAQKELSVTDTNQRLMKAEGVLLVENTGLTAFPIADLRRKARKADALFKVAKNRLVIRALEGTQFEELKGQLKGPTAMVICNDTVAAAKTIVAFAKDNPKLKILGGAMGKDIFDAKGIEALSKLPGLNELRGKIIGLLQAPATKLAGVLQAPAGQLARVVKAHAEQG